MSDGPTAKKPVVVLVTGGSGLVGTAIEQMVQLDEAHQKRRHPDDKWVFLSSKDCDLTNAAACDALFDRLRPTHVIHAAARVGGLYMNLKYKVEVYTANFQMNTNVMDCCYRYKVEKLVSVLSTCIFPEKATYPMSEEALHQGPPPRFHEGYAYAKRMIEVMSRMYHAQFGCRFTSVVPTNIFGPRDNYSLEDSHVMPGLVHKFYLAKKNGTPLTVWGSGRALRQFIYSEDLARLILWKLFDSEELDPVIMSSDPEEEITIKELVGMIGEATGFTGEIQFDTTKSDGQIIKTVSTTKLRTLLPEFRPTPLREAIQRTVDWFAANYEKARL